MSETVPGERPANAPSERRFRAQARGLGRGIGALWLGIMFAGCGQTSSPVCEVAPELDVEIEKFEFVYPDGERHDLAASGASDYRPNVTYDPEAGPGDMLRFSVSLPASSGEPAYEFGMDIQIPWPDRTKSTVGVGEASYGRGGCRGHVAFSIKSTIAGGSYDEETLDVSDGYQRRYLADGVLGDYFTEALDQCPEGRSPLEGTTVEFVIDVTPRCPDQG